MLTLPPSDLRPTYKNRANFDYHHPHKNKVNRSPVKIQAIFGPHKTTKSTAIPALNPGKFLSILKTKRLSARTQQNQFRPPAYKNQCRHPHQNKVNFDPHNKNQDKIEPITEIKSISIPALMSSRFRCPETKKRVNFDPDTKNKSFSTATQKPSQL